MEFLPISWRLQGKSALLVGGGEVALRKGRLLHRSGAQVNVVAPEVCAELCDIVAQSGGKCFERAFESGDLTGQCEDTRADHDARSHGDGARQADRRVVPCGLLTMIHQCLRDFRCRGWCR